jgi:hypothetical protein
MSLTTARLALRAAPARGVVALSQARLFRTVSDDGSPLRDGCPPKRGLYDPSLEKGA